jgi:hypothetical protein
MNAQSFDAVLKSLAETLIAYSIVKRCGQANSYNFGAVDFDYTTVKLLNDAMQHS